MLSKDPQKLSEDKEQTVKRREPFKRRETFKRLAENTVFCKRKGEKRSAREWVANVRERKEGTPLKRKRLRGGRGPLSPAKKESRKVQGKENRGKGKKPGEKKQKDQDGGEVVNPLQNVETLRHEPSKGDRS